MATDVVAYVAMSLDGYIAHEDGTADLLERFGSAEFEFHGFFADIGSLVMGATTYERILEGSGWPYGSLPALVLTSRDLATAEGATVTFSNEPTGDAIRAYAASSTDKRVWVLGGGTVITDGFNAGAIDTLELYVMPVAFGSGIPLFAGPVEGALELVESAAFSNGVIKLIYRAGAAAE